MADMVSLWTFLAELVRSAVQLVFIFVRDVAFRSPLDPLALVSFAMGALVMAVTVLVMGYLVLGAVGDLFTGDGDAIGRTPPPQR